ncbi:hypothetical protein C8F01DRAFT_1228198 [Mycena amicta]|nr:hypothetical protein C8F01DRAFT_1228198 [Mycena amicta]
MATQEPRLPPELEREIFELAADSSPLSVVRSLVLVARRVREWTEPFLFKSLTMDNAATVKQAFFPIDGSKPPAFFARAVREIIIDTESPVALSAFRLCTGATHVAVSSSLAKSEVMSILTHMPLRRLAANLSSHLPLEAFIVELPFCQNLTHLDLYDGIDGQKQYQHFLAALPALTHLSLADLPHWSVVEALLADCNGLQILAVLGRLTSSVRVAANRTAAALVPIRDVRFVMGTYTEWWEGALLPGSLGGAVYWERAERFVQAKRNKEISDDCFWFD